MINNEIPVGEPNSLSTVVLSYFKARIFKKESHILAMYNPQNLPQPINYKSK